MELSDFLFYYSAFRSYFPTLSLKMEILFYSVSFCPPNSLILLIEFSWPRKAIRRQLRKHTKTYREQMSPIGPYF